MRSYQLLGRIGCPAFRLNLLAQREPYWFRIRTGLYLGYRKGAKFGTWVARRYDPQLTPKTSYRSIGLANDAPCEGISFEDATKMVAQWAAQTSEDSVVTNGRYYVVDAINDYLGWMDVHRKSAQETRKRANALIVPTLGTIEASSLTAAQIRKWHYSLSSVGPRRRTRAGHPAKHGPIINNEEFVRRRRATANRTLTILKAALNFAWRDGRIGSDNAWRRVRAFPGVNASRTRYLSLEEGRRLVLAAEPAFSDLINAALLTGARYGELAALEMEDYDPLSGTLHIRTSKNGNGRHLVLNSEGASLFNRLVNLKPKNAKIFKKATGSIWLPGHQKRPMKIALKTAGLDASISFHQLRHTWASLSLMGGATHMVVAQNLGHVDTRMVERHYGHLANNYVAEMIRRTAPKFFS